MALCAPDRLLGLLLWSTLRAHSRTWLLHRGNPTALARYFDCPFRGVQGGAMYLSASTVLISVASFTSCSAVSVDSIQLFTIGAKPGVADRCHHNRFPATASQSHDTYDTLTCDDTWALALTLTHIQPIPIPIPIPIPHDGTAVPPTPSITRFDPALTRRDVT